MAITKKLVPALLCLTAVLPAGIAAAEPAAPQQNPGPQVQGADHGVGFRTALTDDQRATVTTLNAGRFLATWDGQAILVTDDAGLELATVPLKYEIAGKTLALTPDITDNHRRLTLTPVGESPVALRDISAQQRFFDLVQANLPMVGGGAAIGAAIGFLLGFPAGAFVLDFITIPITTVVGALIGAAAGLYLAGGQPAIDTAVEYAASLVPGAAPA
ncbi:hypothetical protein LTV02_24190 [Nocardia yamanashiensis]|uniref:hypothetical protein n=1 Tax=Nocardia yamanashiensis TaxID=209247 RepID=UPI001E3FDD24|nr:hypothetical protein [Nocardia yamanashiensis]UGT39185.1 hypothetical protein LTV02_24190 [Nocardia yamanashiensis]